MKIEFSKKEEVKNILSPAIEFISDEEIKIINEKELRGNIIDKLVYEATFNSNKDVVDFCRFLIKLIAEKKGIVLASIHNYYKQKAKDQKKITIPAINIRGMSYNTAQAVIESAKNKNTNAFILEIAKSEIKYTNQRPAEYVTSILAAAIKKDYQGLLFLQGDHFQISAEKYKENPDQEREEVKELIKEAITAGFYQIDLDMSTLVDWSKQDYDSQQKTNYEETANLTAYVRDLEKELGLAKKGIIISLGGEIGEIGKGIKGRNSTVEDLRAFMNGYLKEITKKSKEKGCQLEGIVKIAIQTGTCHGGIRDEKGNIVKEVKLSFNALAEVGKAAREEYNLAGIVQHGASTLDPHYFGIFAGYPNSLGGSEISEELLTKSNAEILSENPVAEVHLATAYQDTIFDHPVFPEELAKEIKKWVLENYPPKQGEDPEKAYKGNRKRAWGPFKLQVWNLPPNVQKEIQETLVNQFSEDVFKNLGVQGFNIEKYI